MLPHGFVLVAIMLRLISGGGYLWGVLRGKVTPNPLTWFFWGLTPMIAFVAQLQESVGIQAWMTFALGVGPLVIFVASVIKNPAAVRLDRGNVVCGVLAIAGIVLWRCTANPLLAIAFSILADIFGGLPTVLKSYRQPSSEYALPYLLSMVSMVMTVMTLQTWTFASYAFPVYIFMINLVIFTLVQSRWGVRVRARTVRVLVEPDSAYYLALAQVRPL